MIPLNVVQELLNAKGGNKMIQHVEILWDDLSRSGKKKIADAIKIPVKEIVAETNWDIYPVLVYDYDDTPGSL